MGQRTDTTSVGLLLPYMGIVEQHFAQHLPRPSQHASIEQTDKASIRSTPTSDGIAQSTTL
eukprot:12827898-Ditylum_brightwellii.AAC.1